MPAAPPTPHAVSPRMGLESGLGDKPTVVLVGKDASNTSTHTTPPTQLMLPGSGPAGPAAGLAREAAAAHAASQAASAPEAFRSHHRTAFSAIAALLAGCMERGAAAEPRASFAAVDVLLPPASPEAAAPAGGQLALSPLQHWWALQEVVLSVEDDAVGLPPNELRRCMGMPQSSGTFSGHASEARGGAGDASSSPCSSSGGGGGGGGGSPGTAGSAGSAGSASWPDLVHAALHLGSTALVLTKRCQQGASVAIMHCPAGSGASTPPVQLACIDFAANGRRQLSPCADSASGAAAVAASASWQAALDSISTLWFGGRSGVPTEALLLLQLAAMPPQGTQVLVAGLRRQAGAGAGTFLAARLAGSRQGSASPSAEAAAAAAAAGAVRPLKYAYEMDVESNPKDIRVRPASGAAAGVAAGQLVDAQGQSGTAQRAQRASDGGIPGRGPSLRSHMALLFLTWPPGFRLRLRGTEVRHFWTRLRDSGQWQLPGVEYYRPRGVRDEIDQHGCQMPPCIEVHLGTLNAGAARPGLQGHCMYYRNRLVRPFCRPSPATAPSSVVGYVEANILEPMPDWQDFKPCAVLAKLESFLKRAVLAYCERKGQLTLPHSTLPMGGAQLPVLYYQVVAAAPHQVCRTAHPEILPAVPVAIPDPSPASTPESAATAVPLGAQMPAVVAGAVAAAQAAAAQATAAAPPQSDPAPRSDAQLQQGAGPMEAQAAGQPLNILQLLQQHMQQQQQQQVQQAQQQQVQQAQQQQAQQAQAQQAQAQQERQAQHQQAQQALQAQQQQPQAQQTHQQQQAQQPQQQPAAAGQPLEQLAQLASQLFAPPAAESAPTDAFQGLLLQLLQHLLALVLRQERQQQQVQQELCSLRQLLLSVVHQRVPGASGATQQAQQQEAQQQAQQQVQHALAALAQAQQAQHGQQQAQQAQRALQQAPGQVAQVTLMQHLQAQAWAQQAQQQGQLQSHPVEAVQMQAHAQQQHAQQAQDAHARQQAQQQAQQVHAIQQMQHAKQHAQQAQQHTQQQAMVQLQQAVAHAQHATQRAPAQQEQPQPPQEQQHASTPEHSTAGGQPSHAAATAPPAPGAGQDWELAAMHLLAFSSLAQHAASKEPEGEAEEAVVGWPVCSIGAGAGVVHQTRAAKRARMD